MAKANINQNIIAKLKTAGLVGRGGACYPTWMKWQAVKDNMSKLNPDGRRAYVICNVSEGEPGVKKDGFVLRKWPDRVVDGMKIAVHFLGAERGYIYINEKYYQEMGGVLGELTDDTKIDIFIKPHEAGYIGGEENSIMNAIEGRKIEPRLRPPFPVEKGLWGYPTLINNVETFYNVHQVNIGKYKNTRFVTIAGDCLWEGVYEFDINAKISEILAATKNLPGYPFFVQIGGGASGEVLDSDQLDAPVTGAGSITVYSKIKHSPLQVLRNWANYFQKESCGQCTPCREGTYRLRNELNKPNPDWELIAVLLDNLRFASFCGLGCSVPIPIRSYIQNVVSKMPEEEIRLPNATKQMICECLK